MPFESIALFVLATIAAGGVAWVFIYPFLSGERHVEKRKESVAKPERITRAAAAQRAGPKVRREQVEETLKELEQRQKKAKSPALSIRIQQAGLSWSKNQFLVLSAVMGLLGLGVGLAFGLGLLVSAGLAFAAAFGLPRWLLAFSEAARKRIPQRLSRCRRRYRARH